MNGSRVDNQPLSILEAYSCGVPVITTDAGGIPDMVTDGVTGLIVPMDDHEALAKAAIMLLDNPEIAKRIIAEARKECERYRWDVVRIQWLDAYTNHRPHQ